MDEQFEDVVQQLTQYQPFAVSQGEASDPAFVMDVLPPSQYPSSEGYTEELSQDDEGTQISAGRVGNSPYFDFSLRGVLSAKMMTNESYDHAMVTLIDHPLFGLNNALMVMYALATSNRQTALFHSSVISYQGKGYMFLGKSGTGKSTHSSLWLKYIEGTELMNDDNPVVRILDGKPWVFGSPWSGKTPCYRNVKAPIGAIVRLSQAPSNQIVPLKGVQAYAALVPSISGKRWDQRLAEGLHETENLLVEQARLFHLDCLPDEDAARTCWAAVTKK